MYMIVQNHFGWETFYYWPFLEGSTGCSEPPLGDSDHNIIHLVPLYKQRLKTSKPELRTIQIWNEEAPD